MKLFKRIVLALVFFIVLVTGTLLVITFAYENEVKDYMIQQLNANLKTKVIVDSKNIKLSLFNDFPYASLSFKNVTMLEAPISNSKADKKGNKKFIKQDTLFCVEEISLQFNILDILRKKYVVKKVSADNGMVKLRLGADGSQNWDVWKGNGDTAASTQESAFNLEKFKLENISLKYYDFKSKNEIGCDIRKSTIGGEFTSKQYDLSITGDLMLKRCIIDSVNYGEEKPVKLDLNLKADNEKNSYEFSEGILYVSDLKIAVEGRYIFGKTSDFVDISLKGKDMNVQSVLSLLPAKYHKDITDYDSDGEFYCNARIKGKIDELNSPEVKAEFGITKADITQRSSGIALKDVHVIGNYFASAASSKYFLDLKTFSASLANGRIAGSIRIDNFSAPSVAASLRADLLLEDVRHLLKVDTIWNYPIESLAGVMKINMEYKGKLNASGKYTRSDFQNMLLSGDMALENAGLKIRNSSLSFDSINGSFILHDNSVTVNSFSGRTPKSDFYLKGELKDILAYSLSDDADINVDATFQSNNFDLNEFLLDQQESSRRDTVYNIHFSPRMNFILNSNIGRLTFRKFEATHMRGTFQLRNQKLIGDPITFSTMDGSVVASGMIDGASDSTLLVTCNASLNRLSINKLFIQLEDFGQSTMTHDNLKGIGTAEIQFASVWKPDLTVDLNRIYVHSTLTVEKGELIKFEPMKALSKYIEVAELEDIKFPTMQNIIEIKDQKIFIPKMDIHSSALDLTLSGTHTFNNDIDYHVKVLMSDILFQKARKAKKENSEFGVIEDDKSGRTSLFILMTGTVDDPIFKYDKLGAKQNLKENIADERHSLKQILKDEFGMFKKDTTLNKKNKPKDDGKFIIKWDEDEKDKGKKEDDDF
jgi:uncharacterized protein involved in outer membrane biogenesis